MLVLDVIHGGHRLRRNGRGEAQIANGVEVIGAKRILPQTVAGGLAADGASHFWEPPWVTT